VTRDACWILALPFVALAAFTTPAAHAASGALQARAAPPARSGTWQPPVGGAVLRSFRLGSNPYAPGQHRGVDLGAPPGTLVRSVCGGRVSFAGRVPGGGRTVSVRCGRIIATYQQLGSIAVRRGQPLAPGVPLATAGRSGDPRTPRAHVHLGARDAASGRYIDPLTLLRGAARPVTPLLPPGSGRNRRPPPPGPAPAPARPAPRAAPVQRSPGRVPLGRAPAPAPISLREADRAPVPLGRSVPASQAHPTRLPWPVWAGLASIALALPAGGLITIRRRRCETPRHGIATAR
jgi:hypothetical protein